ncbi:MAG: hypothetical protein QM765_07995 [Myxococcales bacterium]
MVKATRRLYSAVTSSVWLAAVGTGAVRASIPRMPLAAALPGIMGMQPATASALPAMAYHRCSSCTPTPTAIAAANEAASRLQPAWSPTVRTAKARAPAAAVHTSDFGPKLKSTPNPAAAIAPKSVW